MSTGNLVTKQVLQQELGKLKDRMDTGFKRTDKRLKSLENRIIKKLNIIAEFFDKPILEYEKRIKRVEDHLGFPQL